MATASRRGFIESDGLQFSGVVTLWVYYIQAAWHLFGPNPRGSVRRESLRRPESVNQVVAPFFDLVAFVHFDAAILA
jgi:hypothetical protein